MEKLNQDRRILLVFLLLLGLFSSWGQSGGKNVFTFLEAAPSARIQALNSSNFSDPSGDINLSFLNPSLVKDTSDQSISLSHNFHLGKTQQSNIAYGHHIAKINSTAFINLRYMNYGDFQGTDEFGNSTHIFNASDVAVSVGISHKLSQFLTGGASLKLISSRLESYKASGLGFDFGLHYYFPEKKFSFGLVLQNIGGVLSNYVNSKEAIPANVAVGISKKMRYLPLRIFANLHHINNWDYKYDGEEENIFLFDEPKVKSQFVKELDNLFRHLSFGGEFVLGQSEGVKLRVSYDHLRKKELSVNPYRSLGGFGFGVGLKVKKFDVDFGMNAFHIAGSTVHFSISSNIGSLFSPRLLD
jgi:hypothetical protein